MGLGLFSISGGLLMCLNGQDDHAIKVVGSLIMFMGLIYMVTAAMGVYGAKHERSSIMKIYTCIVIGGIVLKTASFGLLLYSPNDMQKLPQSTLIGGIIDFIMLIFTLVCSLYYIRCIKHKENLSYSRFNVEGH